MRSKKAEGIRLSRGDVEFLIDTVAPEVSDRARLRQIIADDEDFRKQFIGDEAVFRRVMDEEEIFLRISPVLFFEILLRKAATDLQEVGYTIEKTTTMTIPVFDTTRVVDLLNNDSLRNYLADMLSSFTRVRSYSVSLMLRKGEWKEVRFNDLDILSLMSLSEFVDEEYKVGLYKRIADICLFILGLFPKFAEREYRYPFSGQLRPEIAGRIRFSPEDYEKEGRKFYELAAEHVPSDQEELSRVFRDLHEQFQNAKKPLNYIADKYLRYKQYPVFG